MLVAAPRERRPYGCTFAIYQTRDIHRKENHYDALTFALKAKAKAEVTVKATAKAANVPAGVFLTKNMKDKTEDSDIDEQR